MNLSFSKNDPTKSMVVDTDSGEPLYDIDTTTLSIRGGMTTIRRMDEKERVVAQVNWVSFGPDMVQLEDKWMEVKSFLSRASTFSSSRVFVAPNGVEYKWKSDTSGSKFRLLDCQTQEIVAESHRKKYGFFGGNPRPMNLEITPQVVEFLDVVLVTFVIMEKTRRDMQKSANAASAASASASAGAAAAASVC